MPSFSLRDLFWAITLIIIGFGFVCIALKPDCDGPQRALVLLSPPSIGAGIGSLYQRKVDGLWYGLLMTLGMIVVAVFMPAVQSARE